MREVICVTGSKCTSLLLSFCFLIGADQMFTSGVMWDHEFLLSDSHCRVCAQTLCKKFEKPDY